MAKVFSFSQSPCGYVAKHYGIKPCSCHNLFETEVQERLDRPGLKIIEPIWQVRIVCLNCDRATPWCEDLSTAVKLWNDSLREEAANG